MTHDFQTPGYESLELSTQIVIAEALRRGLKVEVLDAKENFISISDGKRREYIKEATKTSKDSLASYLLLENKHVAKQILLEKGISVPAGVNCEDKDCSDFKDWQGKKFVVKPKSTNFGIGITILEPDSTEADFKKALDFAFKYDKSVLIEDFIEGEEYRFLIIDDQCIAIANRVPANVIGDGESTVTELVEEKNKDPRRMQNYKSPLEKIKIEEVEIDILKEGGFTPESIPEKGQQVFLRKNSNISTGGDSHDFTDKMHEGYKEIAIESTKAMSAMFCGVDMMIKDVNAEPNPDNHGIIEVNFNPVLMMHDFPYEGKNRNTGKYTLDALGF